MIVAESGHPSAELVGIIVSSSTALLGAILAAGGWWFRRWIASQDAQSDLLVELARGTQLRDAAVESIAIQVNDIASTLPTLHRRLTRVEKATRRHDKRLQDLIRTARPGPPQTAVMSDAPTT